MAVCRRQYEAGSLQMAVYKRQDVIGSMSDVLCCMGCKICYIFVRYNSSLSIFRLYIMKLYINMQFRYILYCYYILILFIYSDLL